MSPDDQLLRKRRHGRNSVNATLINIGQGKDRKKRSPVYWAWWIPAVTLVSVYALGEIVPVEWAWENSPLEWLQVGILALGMFQAGVFAVRTYRRNDIILSRFWSWTVLPWFIIIARELSWGRVFFQLRVGEKGPEFPPLHQLWYGKAVYPVLTALALVWIIAAVRYRTYRILVGLFRGRCLPLPQTIVFICAVLTAFCEEQQYFGHKAVNMLYEELGETIAYVALVVLNSSLYNRFLSRSTCQGGSQPKSLF